MKRLFCWQRLLATVALVANFLPAHANDNPNIEQDLTGTIEYRSTDTGEWRGEDRFRLTVHPDGSKTMRNTTRLDNTLILRDVVTRVSKNYDPLDVFVSHWLDGAHRGTGFYVVERRYRQCCHSRVQWHPSTVDRGWG